jgi:hypothetical protein
LVLLCSKGTNRRSLPTKQRTDGPVVAGVIAGGADMRSPVTVGLGPAGERPLDEQIDRCGTGQLSRFSMAELSVVRRWTATLGDVARR